MGGCAAEANDVPSGQGVARGGLPQTVAGRWRVTSLPGRGS